MANLDKALEYRHMRAALEQKYGKAYFRAIKKLSLGDEVYDENGYLKPEYEFTIEEKDALMFIVNESDKDHTGRIR